MKGRKPTPTSLRLIKGNPGRRPMPHNEPAPETAIPEKPGFLDREASREWDRIVPELHRLGLVTALDRAILVKYCQAWSAVLELEGEIADTGWCVPTADGGYKRNPLAASLNEAYTRLHSAAMEFGGSPVARVRLATPAHPGEDDPLDELLSRRRA